MLEVAAKLEAVAGVVKLAESGQWEAGQVVEGSDDLMILTMLTMLVRLWRALTEMT